MATSIEQIKGFLDEFELKYVEHEEEPAIASIQMRYKMLRFDYDPESGEVRPNSFPWRMLN